MVARYVAKEKDSSRGTSKVMFYVATRGDEGDIVYVAVESNVQVGILVEREDLEQVIRGLKSGLEFQLIAQSKQKFFELDSNSIDAYDGAVYRIEDVVPRAEARDLLKATLEDYVNYRAKRITREVMARIKEAIQGPTEPEDETIN